MFLIDFYLMILVDYFGIVCDYYDWKGQYIEVGEVIVIVVFDGLGIDVLILECVECVCYEVINWKWC